LSCWLGTPRWWMHTLHLIHYYFILLIYLSFKVILNSTFIYRATLSKLQSCTKS
jgi:hypothetical protein